ncbi:MAG: hypothetical protein K2I10_08925 [Lachnospiraceae bacterium]|nr:hypothetical protein [Lachnospiraceae bacterium]
MKYYYVEPVKMKIGVLTMEPVDKEISLFFSMELVEEWLPEFLKEL